jgi:uncharacterized protein (TIGR02001 family)
MQQSEMKWGRCTWRRDWYTVLLAVVVLAAGAAPAADRLKGYAAVDLSSAYVWRGTTFNDEFVLQPTVNVVTRAGIGVGAWANFDFDDYENVARAGDVSEIDLTAFYRLPVETYTVEVGIIDYNYNRMDGQADSREIYGRVGTEWEGLSAELGIYYDIDEREDFYVDFTVSYGIELRDDLDLVLAASVSHAGDRMAASGVEGWHDMALVAGLNYRVNRDLIIGGSLVYTDRLDHDVLPDPEVRHHWSLHVSRLF